MSLALLVFGRTGQVATELQRLAGPDLRMNALDRAAADLAVPSACAAAIATTDADVVINAAAWTAVDRAEAEEDAAMVVNGHAPGAIARACAARGLPFLHVSTDYVFDGSGARAWREDDTVSPINAYGRTKLEGERQVAAAGGPHAILRTSWVFSAHGANFVKTMLKHGALRDQLKVVDDQRGGPTAAADIAAALVAMARAFNEGRGVSGVFHFAGAPTVSWRDFAVEIFRQADWMRAPDVAPIRTEDWPTPAARPANSALDCAKIEAAYGIAQPDWRASLGRVLAELKETAE
ncbi:MAG: dTDP-4-dehydrorhamnose reductase [Rubrimonas sp.]